MLKKKFSIKATAYDKRGKIISTAYNDYKKSHPVMQHFAVKVGQPERIYLHAEILAILRAGDKEIYTLKVERYDSKGFPACAKPCPACAEAIRQYGVKKVVYTDSVEELVI